LIKNYSGKRKFQLRKLKKNFIYLFRFSSLLIAQTEYLYDTYVDKRKLGYRLDPNRKFLASEFNSILLYDDVHLPTHDESIIYSNRTWFALRKAFSHLFHNETIQLLSRYHYDTAACVLGRNRTTRIYQHKKNIS
jgi:hypothetical protein